MAVYHSSWDSVQAEAVDPEPVVEERVIDVDVNPTSTVALDDEPPAYT